MPAARKKTQDRQGGSNKRRVGQTRGGHGFHDPMARLPPGAADRVARRCNSQARQGISAGVPPTACRPRPAANR
jgi:hypothetical protein